MGAELFQVVTFANDPGRGNPVFVLRTDALPNAEVAAATCDLLGTDFLAALAGGGSAPALGFFTPQGPHSGAGHGALAAALVAFAEEGEAGQEEIRFRLTDGSFRTARRASGGRIAVDWPAMPFEAADDLRAPLADALRHRPLEVFSAAFGHVALLADEGAVAALEPDLATVAALGRAAVIAAAPGGASDIVVRVFAPNVGLPEDPVCGTAHRILAPLWAGRLGKETIHSRHLSPRGGDLWCTVAGESVAIAGEAVVTLRGSLRLPAGSRHRPRRAPTR